MSQHRLEQNVDALIEQIDPCAVRRTHTRARSRSVEVAVEDGTGLATMLITLFATDADAFSARADALADTVCSKDPRTKDQRRADAINPMAHGNDRLACLCGRRECDAAQNPPSTGVIVYVVAHEDTLDAADPETPKEGFRRARGPRSDGLDGSEGREPSAGPDDESMPDDADDSGSTGSAEAGDRSGGVADDFVAADLASEVPAADPATTGRGVGDPDAEYAGLDGLAPPMFSRPLHELTWAQITAPPPPGPPPRLRPAAMTGGRFLPGALTRRAAIGATLDQDRPPGPSAPRTALPAVEEARRVRALPATWPARFPGCREPATTCDVDHTIPWPYGPTQASNLKCLCRVHHLLKTFWAGTPGWRDRQLPDGTVIWTAPDGRTHTSTPGSRLSPRTLRTHRTRARHRSPRPTGAHRRIDDAAPQEHRRQDRTRHIHNERQLNQALIEAEAKAEAEAEAKATSRASRRTTRAVLMSQPTIRLRKARVVAGGSGNPQTAETDSV